MIIDGPFAETKEQLLASMWCDCPTSKPRRGGARIAPRQPDRRLRDSADFLYLARCRARGLRREPDLIFRGMVVIVGSGFRRPLLTLRASTETASYATRPLARAGAAYYAFESRNSGLSQVSNRSLWFYIIPICSPPGCDGNLYGCNGCNPKERRSCPKYHTKPLSTSDEDRRSFLKNCGRFAVVTPPAVTMLLSTSLTSTQSPSPAAAVAGRLKATTAGVTGADPGNPAAPMAGA